MGNDKFIFRSPLMPISNLLVLLKTHDMQKFKLHLNNIYSNQKLREALYISSPILYYELIKADQNESKWESRQFTMSLLKYYIRSCTRCTPFGLFASVNAGDISNEKNGIVILSNKEYSRVGIDFEVLNTLYFHIKNDPEFLDSAFFLVNNSLYKIGNQYRYVEYSIKNGRKVYTLAGVKRDRILDSVINKTQGKVKFSEIVAHLTSFDYTLDEAKDYIFNLIRSQILVDDLIPNICGQEYQERLLTRMGVIEKYETLSRSLTKIISNKNESYIEMGAKLKTLLTNEYLVQVEKNTILKVDSSKTVLKANLNNELIKSVLEATVILTKLQEPRPNINLNKFKRAFVERYESAEINLLESLDSDIGIGYATDIKDSLEDTNIKTSSWTKQRQFKFELLKSFYRGNKMIVYLDDYQIDNLSLQSNPMPDSVSFFGSIIPGDEQDSILFNSIFGPSAINLIGRFGHLSDDIKTLCKSLAKEEEQKNPDKIYASLSHIPQTRVGNVLVREHYRDFEIPYLTYSDLPGEKQIYPSDLTVSVINDKFVLKSKALGKEVVPRNDNAHNYSYNTLPLYHFLSDLQYQDLNAMISWDWGVFTSEKFLPRVVYKNVILTPATWKIDSHELMHLSEIPSDKMIEAFNIIKQNNNLPDFVQLVEGDNVLLLYLNSLPCIEILLNKSKRNKIITLTEFLFKEGNCNLITNSENELFTNEIIVPIIKNTIGSQKVEKTQSHQRRRLLPKNTRTFAPLGEWLYLKLYCSYSASDTIIANIIFPLLSSIRRDKQISKWFFIRYYDTNYHIRVRFQLIESYDPINLYNRIHKKLDQLIKSRQVWNVVIDTYKREIERYGDETIEISETIFSINSDIVCLLLKHINSKEKNFKTLVGLLGVHYMFNAFGLNDKQRIDFVNQMSKGNHIKITKRQRSTTKDTYRKHQHLIHSLINNSTFKSEDSSNIAIKKIYRIYETQSLLMKKYVFADLKDDSIKVSLLNNLGSYIHMFVNRFFESNQNYHEYLIYEFLKKAYTSEYARKNL